MSEVFPETKPERIARLLEAEIRSGVLQDGEALSSENALVERFSVSRSSVRKGLDILAAKGLIRKRVGLGSFVTCGGSVIDNARGWSLALSEAGVTMGARILKISRLLMDLEATGFDGEDVLAVDRIRFREETGAAVTLERARVPWRADFDPILVDGLEGGSLSRTMESRGIVAASGEEWANVLPALSEEDAAIMGRAAGEPMLRLRRLTRAVDGALVEYVESILDPGLFGLHMEF